MKIRTRVLAAGAAITMASVAAMAVPAFAKPLPAPPVNVANDTVQCNTTYGSLKIPVGLNLTVPQGTTFENGAVLKITLDGCVESAGTNAMKKTSLTLDINHVDENCLGLSGLGTATFQPATIKWARLDKTPITPTSSTLTVTQTNGAEFNVGTPAGDTDTWGAAYGMFQVGHDATHGMTSQPSVSGAFTGGDSGHASTADLVTSQDAVAELNLCSSAKGLTAVNVGLGDVALG